MRYFVAESFTLKTPKGDVIFPTGKVLELTQDQVEKLGSKVQILKPYPNDGKDQPHYCSKSDSWCSAKLPGSDYPNSCRRYGCEYLEVQA